MCIRDRSDTISVHLSRVIICSVTKREEEYLTHCVSTLGMVHDLLQGAMLTVKFHTGEYHYVRSWTLPRIATQYSPTSIIQTPLASFRNLSVWLSNELKFVWLTSCVAPHMRTSNMCFYFVLWPCILPGARVWIIEGTDNRGSDNCSIVGIVEYILSLSITYTLATCLYRVARQQS